MFSSHRSRLLMTAALFAVPVLIVLVLVALATSGSDGPSAAPSASRRSTTTTTRPPGPAVPNTSGVSPNDAATSPPLQTAPDGTPIPPSTTSTRPGNSSSSGSNGSGSSTPPPAPEAPAPPLLQLVSYPLCPAVSTSTMAGLTGGGPYTAAELTPGSCVYSSPTLPLLTFAAVSPAWEAAQSLDGAVPVAGLGDKAVKVPIYVPGAGGMVRGQGFDLYATAGNRVVRVSWTGPESPTSLAAARQVASRLISFVRSR